jgi:hypothetical protein
MPPSLARWKRAATVAAAILAASERGFQPRTSTNVMVVRSCVRENAPMNSQLEFARTQSILSPARKGC